MNRGMSLTSTCFEESTLHMARARKGRFPKDVMLAAPHTNEHPAVILPQICLQRGLEANGVEVKLMNRLGMMGKLWKLRSALDREFPGNSREPLAGALLTSILSLRDLHDRVQNMHNFFRNCPEGVFMEMHAMSDAVIMNSSLLSPEQLRDFLQISGTNMLICRESLRSFSESVAEARRAEIDVYSSLTEQIARASQPSVRGLLLAIKSRIEEIYRFSAVQAAEECDARLSELDRSRGRIFIVEIPSERKDLPPEHRMHRLYFQPSARQVGDATILTSSFEEVYASCTRESIGFSDKDAEALLNQLKIC